MYVPGYYEDYRVGQILPGHAKTLTEAEIIEFAWKYDPQPFHIDVTAAEKSQFGGLISSGFHTIAVTFRLFHQLNGFHDSSLASPGIEQIRWLKPVYAGDTIRAEVEILDKRESQSRADRGYATLLFRTFNQRDELVMTMRSTQILARRPAA